MQRIVKVTRYTDWDEKRRRNLKEKEEKYYVFTDFDEMGFFLEQKLELRYEGDGNYSRIDEFGLTTAETFIPETP